jgi:hypothetical protein
VEDGYDAEDQSRAFSTLSRIVSQPPMCPSRAPSLRNLT